MNFPLKNFTKLAIVLLCFSFLASPLYKLHAERERTPKNVGIDEKLGRQVALDVPLLLEDGSKHTLRSLLEKYQKPVILVPSYYTCPHLCTFIFNGIAEAIKSSNGKNYELGVDYHIFSFSIDPDETQAQAQQRGNLYRDRTETTNPEHWQFLRLSSKEDIQTLTNSIGFRYKKDKNMYSHNAIIVFVSKQGKIIRYLYGVNYLKRDMRLALFEATGNKVGRSLSEKILLYCFHYDLIKGKYAPHAWAFLRIGGALTLLFLVGLIAYLLFTRRRKF